MEDVFAIGYEIARKIRMMSMLTYYMKQRSEAPSLKALL